MFDLQVHQAWCKRRPTCALLKKVQISKNAHFFSPIARVCTIATCGRGKIQQNQYFCDWSSSPSKLSMRFLEEKFQFSWKYTVVFSSPNNVVNISDVMACSMKTTHSTRGKSYENGLSPFARVPSCNVLLLILLTLAPRQRFLCVFILVAFL